MCWSDKESVSNILVFHNHHFVANLIQMPSENFTTRPDRPKMLVKKLTTRQELRRLVSSASIWNGFFYKAKTLKLRTSI